MGRFSPQTLEQVAAANDVAEVIGAYVPLRRAGTSFKALCPFHRERSPSFHVNPQRQSFHCFGCGKGGSVFRFVMEYENLDFPAAVRRLADRAGITLVEEADQDGDAAAARGHQRRRLLGLHAAAADWFHHYLLKKEAAAPARAYLQGRSLGREIAVAWKLGYAPPEREALVQWGRAQGYSAEELLASGLVRARDEEPAPGGLPGPTPAGEAARGPLWGRFRHRLMFPVCNELGEVIAFSGRALPPAPKEVPKYVNSPETILFTKGNVLFGLHRSRRAILEARAAVVCEGQIDLIRAFEAGVTHVIAPQGTAFTERQARLLKRYADEVILCFDADPAGQQAAERSLPALLEVGLAVRVATMPAGEDPDSLIRQHGPDAFRARLAAAVDFFDFQTERLGGLFDLTTPRGKVQFSRRMAESVVLVGDPLLRQTIVNKVTSRLGVAPEEFHALLRQTRPRPAVPTPAAAMPSLTGVPAPGGPGPGPGRAGAPPPPPGPESAADRADPGEQPPFQTPPERVSALLALALRDDAVHAWLRSQTDWRQVLERTAGAELLYRILADARLRPSDPATVNAFLTTLSPAEEAYLSVERQRRAPALPPMELAQQWWFGLEEMALRQRSREVQNQLRQPDLSPGEVTELQKEIVDLKNRLADIARPLPLRPV